MNSLEFFKLFFLLKKDSMISPIKEFNIITKAIKNNDEIKNAMVGSNTKLKSQAVVRYFLFLTPCNK